MFSIYVEEKIHRIKSRLCRVPFQIRNWLHDQRIMIELSYYHFIQDLGKENSSMRYIGPIIFYAIVGLGWFTVFFVRSR